MNNVDFRIVSLSIDNLDIEFDYRLNNSSFIHEKNNKNYNSKSYVSVFIGQNGVGKSYILRNISYIFFELYELKYPENGFKFNSNLKNYKITYKIGDNTYYVEKKRNQYLIYINGIRISTQQYELICIPNGILCCAFQINDKFRYVRESDFYKYLGIKSQSSFTNSKTVSKAICNNIMKIIYSKNNQLYLKLLRMCFDFIGLSPQITISYKIKKKQQLLENNIDINNIEGILHQMLSRRNGRATFAQSVLHGIKNNKDTLEELVHQIRKLQEIINLNENYTRRTSTINTQIDLETGEIFSNNKINMREYIIEDAFELLNKLDIIGSPEIIVRKSDYFEVKDGSSGELHILFLLTNIIANIENNSLILIDEPEASLHPTWQMKLVNLIQEILGIAQMNCQIIIATHSHFVLSSLKAEESTIHIIKKDKLKNENVCENLEYSIYGWSAENILFKVFGVPSNRNYYLAKDLDRLLELISNGKENKVLKRKDDLISISKNLVDEDPLKDVIREIINKISIKEIKGENNE